ncbi:GDP-mannose-dependent alpha-(1-6)-phosphatidylinositol monomannoside mannosyltransferase [Gemmata obscuriglobus]|uniref:Glycosyltransferase family 1 protein n=1 Tax=Gemmata obscuriglobus TaxID=114 RepID=A0A2Z3GYM2_9BACT|nr:glycosyltransferase family 4 protein [Gemmata obscuriglobus]AWM39599.1 glycosyltransferase family 1 protein [Gemmata obscuriglobus]QEG27302.1 GDP-mannose-dependent alpha-(1-6)-phosphatidylinositol monomannoside mannosyltransferase [Gemmata obscuriglobus]VTS04119.1 group 1 glycosyl transferase : Group 1 glycosyl transferase OS=Corallococcus coralloides (strain ATCC 25202 / DSM 2259 / NBRC 100086 / M2) GN=pimB1 PE=4 SV=1: Glycos_transf_1 [Gemmata obscuriglobus UQM 2246]
MKARRLLTVGHSYVVALNRRLAHEMALAGRGTWEVTAVAPKFVYGDLRQIELEPYPGEACRLEPVAAYLSRWIHVMAYGRRVRALLREPWDLVHCWGEPYTLSGFQVARWAPAGAPFVFWTAQNLAKRYPLPFRWFERSVLRRADGWLACGQTTVDAQLGRDSGYDSKPHRVMPLGVDLDVFRPDPVSGAAVRRQLGWDVNGPPVVGYLGRFIGEKGLPLLTRALDMLSVPWRALFVGGGPLEIELRTWGQKYGDRVRVVTGVPHDRVPAHLAAMDVLAAPSQTTPRWKEQLGRMLIEAFACGVAVAGSDSGEIPHVIGDAGRVVPEADEAAWAVTLAELVENRNARDELAARGLERARTAFAWPVVAGQHLDFFNELLDRSRYNRG